MRWKSKQTKVPEIKDTRVVSRFLWLPLSLNGETRWLEWAEIIQEYLNDTCLNPEYYWVDKEWKK